ncbi:predicted protein [Sclerotinia sclerotiorum 1980 UF-70]|uniref:Uncharacterized protein n=1 Tax=Sclerotinia sclerotiorum (strain ATCC 18683 / 1980 / Ss-1) TaxID=665079 RepID=A7F7V0_SCLS1|nr:predicted protein [Sclerotinia sclerotiorum 1980 UF-70]EDN98821.1 predicted protein [Sclerotinia sclerotiorum 1980 UF-70]
MAEYQECGGGGFIGRGMNSRVGGSIVEKEGEYERKGEERRGGEVSFDFLYILHRIGGWEGWRKVEDLKKKINKGGKRCMIIAPSPATAASEE